jgi:hypothetical protein
MVFHLLSKVLSLKSIDNFSKADPIPLAAINQFSEEERNGSFS